MLAKSVYPRRLPRISFCENWSHRSLGFSLSSPAASPCAKPTATALAHVRPFLGLSVKVNISEHYEATGIEKENGPEPVPGCPGVNPRAIESLGRGQGNSLGGEKKGHFTEFVRWTNWPLSRNAVTLLSNPKEPTYKSCYWYFCWNIPPACFLSKQNPFVATKMKSRDKLLLLVTSVYIWNTSVRFTHAHSYLARYFSSLWSHNCSSELPRTLFIFMISLTSLSTE